MLATVPIRCMAAGGSPHLGSVREDATWRVLHGLLRGSD
jgi:hypothetical protein